MAQVSSDAQFLPNAGGATPLGPNASSRRTQLDPHRGFPDRQEIEADCDNEQMLKSQEHRERFRKPADDCARDVRSERDIGIGIIAKTSGEDDTRKEHGTQSKQARNNVSPKHVTTEKYLKRHQHSDRKKNKQSQVVPV